MKTIYALVMGFAVLGLSAKAQTTSFLTNGLLAYYPLNGDSADYSGNENNGVIFGAPSFTNGVNGLAFNFNGNTRMVVNDAPLLDTTTNAITLSAWFKANDWNGNNRILQKGDVQYQFTSSFGVFNFGLGSAVGTNGTANIPLPSIGYWHHAVGTYDGTSMKIYIDGELITNQLASSNLIPASNPSGNTNILLNIGAKPDSTNPVDFFHGLIENVRIYNRSLSPNEVSSLYNFESFSLGILSVPTVEIQGLTNRVYTIQYVNDLVSTNWLILVSNIVIQNSPFYYPDTNSIGLPKRFYRVLEQ